MSNVVMQPYHVKVIDDYTTYTLVTDYISPEQLEEYCRNWCAKGVMVTSQCGERMINVYVPPRQIRAIECEPRR